MRSKDFRKYTIVRKNPNYDYFGHKPDDDQIQEIKRNHDESYDKTFWMYDEDGELVGRFSIESAPQWVMEIFNILTEKYRYE